TADAPAVKNTSAGLAPSAHSLGMVPGAVGHNDPEDHATFLRGSHQRPPPTVRSGIRNLDDNASGARLGAWPPHEEVFYDFPIVCGGKRLSANLAMNQAIYGLCAGTHAHHLVVRLTLWALKLLIIVHRRADIQIQDALQVTRLST